jgi:hypothetical protein
LGNDLRVLGNPKVFGVERIVGNLLGVLDGVVGNLYMRTKIGREIDAGMLGFCGFAFYPRDHRERGRLCGVVHEFGGESEVNLRFCRLFRLRRLIWFLFRW